MAQQLGALLAAIVLLPVLAAGETARREFTYDDFTDTDSLAAVGDALAADPARLTDEGTYQRGADWHEIQLPLFPGFENTFTFRLTPPVVQPDPSCAGTPGDGIALVIQRVATDALGGAGYGLGYGTAEGTDGITNSLAVELDTFANQTGAENTNDPSGDHVGVQTRGNAPNSPDHASTLGVATTTIDPNDGQAHTARIRYESGMLSVYLDGVLQLATLTDLTALDVLSSGRAWIGLTGGTGLCVQKQEILSWSHDSLFLFHDGFETGDLVAWTSATGAVD